MKICCDQFYVEKEIFFAITSLPVFLADKIRISSKGKVYWQLELSSISNQNLPATVESMSSDTFLFVISPVPLVGCLNKYITWRS